MIKTLVSSKPKIIYFFKKNLLKKKRKEIKTDISINPVKPIGIFIGSTLYRGKQTEIEVKIKTDLKDPIRLIAKIIRKTIGLMKTNNWISIK